jgi:hypothetical protein
MTNGNEEKNQRIEADGNGGDEGERAGKNKGKGARNRSEE